MANTPGGNDAKNGLNTSYISTRSGIYLGDKRSLTQTLSEITGVLVSPLDAWDPDSMVIHVMDSFVRVQLHFVDLKINNVMGNFAVMLGLDGSRPGCSIIQPVLSRSYL